MSLVEDYRALHDGVAGRVVARDVVQVSGPDAESYLQGQCSQDVSALAVGGSADALLLSPQGKLQAYLRVTRTADDVFLLDTDGGFGPDVTERLERFKLRTKAVVEPLVRTCLALRGPAVPADAASWPGVTLAVPFAWGTLRGLDLFGDGLALPAGLHSCGEAAWEAARIEAGVPAMGRELDERTIAAEAALLERCVSFTKGCYTGQELVARLDARGNRVARHLRGLVLGGAAPAEDEASPPVPAGSDLVDPAADKVVGSVTSSAWSPSLGAVALGYVHRDVGPGTSLAVRVADGPALAAEVRTLPLGA